MPQPSVQDLNVVIAILDRMNNHIYADSPLRVVLAAYFPELTIHDLLRATERVEDMLKSWATYGRG